MPIIDCPTHECASGFKGDVKLAVAHCRICSAQTSTPTSANSWFVPRSFPKGVCLGLRNSITTQLWLNTLPLHITQLDLSCNDVRFSAKTVAHLSHLFVERLWAYQPIPPTLEYLFVREYDGEPIPKVTNICFHSHDLDKIEKADVGEHYLHYIEEITDSELNTERYRTVGKRITMDVFGYKYDVIKRVPIIDPKVIIERRRIINEQISILQKEDHRLFELAYDQISDNVLQQSNDQTRE